MYISCPDILGSIDLLSQFAALRAVQLDEARGPLGDRGRRQRELAAHDGRHDRRVRHAQAGDAGDAQLLVDDLEAIV